MYDVELDLLEQVERLAKLRLGLSRITHDRVGRDREVGNQRTRVGDDRAIFVPGVAASHLLEDRVVTRLKRQVQVLAHAGKVADGQEQVVMDVARMRGEEPDTP